MAAFLWGYDETHRHAPWSQHTTCEPSKKSVPACTHGYCCCSLATVAHCSFAGIASEWVSLPATAEAVAAVEGLSAGLDMRCGGRVRTALREALLHGQLSRGHVSLVLRGPSRTSTLALTLSLTSP